MITTKLVTELFREDPELAARIKRLAAAEGSVVGYKAYAARLIDRALRQATGVDMLRPADVAKALGCSKRTVYRDLAAGVYPNARWKNQRVCLIPMSDVQAVAK